MFKFWAAHNGIEIDGRVSGYAWVAICIAITLWAPAYLAGARSLSLTVLSLIPALWIIGLKDIGILGANWAPIAGYLALAGGIFGLYTSSAIILNDKFGKTVLPLGSPFIKPKAPPSNPDA